MYNLREELIKSVIASLKIDDNPFNSEIIREHIEDIEDDRLKAFYSKLFTPENRYLNGLDRVTKVAEAMKPIIVNKLDEEAKEIIELAEGMRSKVNSDFMMSMSEGDSKGFFMHAKFKLGERDNDIFNNISPYYYLNDFIYNLRKYDTSVELIRVVRDAIERVDNTVIAIESKDTKRIDA